ncbi:MAG: SusF/SusE family outer membrane protein, partial [Lutibacter sp.]
PQFTQTSAGVFEITQTLSANDEFKFVPVAGSWGDDFGESKVSKRVLEQNDENNLKVTAGGSYKITVDFNNGNISVVSL